MGHSKMLPLVSDLCIWPSMVTKLVKNTFKNNTICVKQISDVDESRCFFFF